MAGVKQIKQKCCPIVWTHITIRYKIHTYTWLYIYISLSYYIHMRKHADNAMPTKKQRWQTGIEIATECLTFGFLGYVSAGPCRRPASIWVSHIRTQHCISKVMVSSTRSTRGQWHDVGVSDTIWGVSDRLRGVSDTLKASQKTACQEFALPASLGNFRCDDISVIVLLPVDFV